MADTPKKKRQLKKTETVRQRAERVSNEPTSKKRRLKSTAGKAVTPFKAVGRALARIFRPFAFLLKPFKTKPARKIGRFLASVLLLRFIRDSWKELRLVKWPTARETVRLTMAVFIFSILFGILIAITDYGLDKIFRKVFIE